MLTYAHGSGGKLEFSAALQVLISLLVLLQVKFWSFSFQHIKGKVMEIGHRNLQRKNIKNLREKKKQKTATFPQLYIFSSVLCTVIVCYILYKYIGFRLYPCFAYSTVLQLHISVCFLGGLKVQG